MKKNSKAIALILVFSILAGMLALAVSTNLRLNSLRLELLDTQQQLFVAQQQLSDTQQQLSTANEAILDNEYAANMLRFKLQKHEAAVLFEKEIIDYLAAFQEENSDTKSNAIAKKIAIYKDGAGGEYTLTLSARRWIEFFGSCPASGAIISEFEWFDEWLTPSECPFEVTYEVKCFLEAERTSFSCWTPPQGFDGNIYMVPSREDLHSRRGDYVIGYRATAEGIDFCFSNQEDDLYAEMTISGAHAPKEIYTYPYASYSLYYLVFEYQGEVWAMAEDFTFYRLTPPASAV